MNTYELPIGDEEFIPDQMGPCSAHATINCLQCYDIEPEDLDDDGNLIVVDGEKLLLSLRKKNTP